MYLEPHAVAEPVAEALAVAGAANPLARHRVHPLTIRSGMDRGKRFLLRPGKGAVRATGHFTVAYAAHATAKQFKQFQTFASAVLAAAKTEGAHIGKPE